MFLRVPLEIFIILEGLSQEVKESKEKQVFPLKGEGEIRAHDFS